MRKAIYFSVLGFCFLVSVFLFVLYHFQDFSSEAHFDNNWDFSFSGGDSIHLVESPIGVLNISNNGIFSRYYEFPNFIGCLEFSDSSKLKNPLRSFDIYLMELGIGEKGVSLERKKNFSYTLFGRYSVRGGPSFDDLKESIVGYKIYEAPSGKGDFYSSPYDKSDLCLDLNRNYKPVYSTKF
jgi:hypothetical protein